MKASAMPVQDRLRLHYLNSIKTARPEPGHTHEQSAITPAQSKAPWFAPQSDG